MALEMELQLMNSNKKERIWFFKNSKNTKHSYYGLE